MYVEQPNRITEWQVQDLLRLSKTLDLAPGPGGTRMSDYNATRELYAPIYEHRFAHILGTSWTVCTVIAVYPSQQIPLHCDAPIPGTRYHIPLQLNDGCWVFSEGVWQQLELTKIYSMNPSKPHGAVNWGPDIRLHLIVDVDQASSM